MNEFELFQSALDLDDPAARRLLLMSNCPNDPEMLGRVEALLASHEGQSQFLNMPVVEQIADAASEGAVGTTLGGKGSMQDDEPDTKTVLSSDSACKAIHQDDADDEIPLSYLEPSKKSGSVGRLAHYEILEVIGRGAFGTVLRAFDEKLQRVVAIKVLAPEMAATSPARRRFLREAQASAAIRHEHVVSVYAVEEKPLPYLVMEYIPGLTLQHRLDENGPLDVPTVLRLGRQIAEGLAAAHARDLIHRDIKPGNILLETGVQDRVKITDFGLARAADDASLTQSGTIAGTPMYMAPEQALGHKLDQRADLFSFGSVLYQMVSGRAPFRAPTMMAVLKRVTEDTPRPIREIIPETPQWLCDIITKLHAKTPAERYQSAREIADVLANCESQLKAHSGLKDFSLIPRTKAQPTGFWTWVALVALMFPLMAFGLYALNRSASPAKLAEGETIKTPKTDPVAESMSPETTKPGVADANDWVQLFNGQDLTGWESHPDEPGNWHVEEGLLTGSERQSYLFSQRDDFANFHLRCEVRINAGGDGGIIVHAPFEEPTKNGLPGYEAQLQAGSPLMNGWQTGAISSSDSARGWSLLQSSTAEITPDTWVTLEVIAMDGRIETRLGGKTIAVHTDQQRKFLSGHIALQQSTANTRVQFRRIEIRLPVSNEPAAVSSSTIASTTASVPVKRRFVSDEWIDVIPLIDPQADKWDVPQRTGKNAWRIEQSELVVGGDTLASKLLLPLDSDWPAFECELEFTRRAGDSGLNVNLPTKVGECPLLFDPTGTSGAFLGSRAKGVQLKTGTQLVTGERATIRFDIRRQQDADHVSVSLNGVAIGEWTGDRTAISYSYREGFPHDRRVSLWIHPGGNEFVFHRIRVRMLDGGTAESLRPVPSTPPVAEAKQELSPRDADHPPVEPVRSSVGGTIPAE